MKSSLQQALQIIRDKASNDTELGTAFEKLAKVFLENDATQTQQYSKVWTYTDWAKDRKGYSDRDIGIDLVAELRDGSGYCAIQCKCYQPEHSISKADLDSFISASSTSDFTRLLLIDTSTQNIGKNAQSVFDNLDKDYLRIQLEELEQSRIDWLTYINEGRVHLRSQKDLRDHQIQAIEKVKEGLKEGDRGKLIMACGTGKTFTSLRIAELLAGKGKSILYMVPSLSLMSQTVREWKNDALNDFTAFSACSDIKIGKRSSKQDLIEVSLNDLAFPATTDPSKLSEQIQNADKGKMTVIFSTYHSIDVISEAQFKYDLTEFDLIICDEAHRTTGATLIGEDESNFVRIHSNDNVRGKKRLYMTATPRIFGETAKKKADEGEVALASMDDEETFGKTLFYRGFGWAVENNILTDFKVVVLAVDEGVVSAALQRKWEESGILKLDDATKMVGCYKALAKVGFKDSLKNNSNGDRLKPMKRALAFCQNIELSKIFAEEFTSVINEYIANEEIEEKFKTNLKVDLFHVDGTFNAEQRNERLNWLKHDPDDNICRVLTNVRCLAEGVDVPSLDAIMFLHPRKSQIDVVQGVGRVMRKAEGKDLGYVILPITVAPGVTPEKALRDNEKYKVVWQILNALRAHDERFDSTINRIGLGEDVSDRLEIVGVGGREELDATTAVIEDVKPKGNKGEKNDNEETASVGEQKDDTDSEELEGEQLAFVFTDLSQAIKAKIVEKCGTRDYWENWASDIAKIAQSHITRINAIVLNSGAPERKGFLAFLEEIQDDLNPEITETDAVEMLAQHIITKPVFDTLFEGHKFTSDNAISKAMETVIHQIYKHNIEAESESLSKFYDSVKRRAADIVTTKGRQKLVLELYDRFFRNAFPSTTQKLGIVYTPVEVVDFIIHSVNDILKDEFDKSLKSKNVHILDPFTGTGTFITRLIQSGLISEQDLDYKYKHEIHVNEMVLLAYYIASINIESVYQDLDKENKYKPFNGMVFTDTFQLFEQERDMIANLLPDNSNRRTAQKKKKIMVVIGNPPYSAGQSSANDDAANVSYNNLDQRIQQTYAKASSATNKKDLYDSYIRAFRWASDRLGEEGVIGFVSNAGWIDGTAADGLRKHLHDEFNKIYIFHLRGNARTSGELRRKEKGNVFGEGTRTPITITILVKKLNSKEKGQIYFHDIGDYLDRKQKLKIIQRFKSINGILAEGKFKLLKPDENNDWVYQGDKIFNTFIKLGDKKDRLKSSIFQNYSLGINTNRDAWSYNYSTNNIKSNIKKLIKTYNKELISKKTFASAEKNPKLIKWSSSLEQHFSKGKKLEFKDSAIVISSYRPFNKVFLYYEPTLVHRMGQMRNIFSNKNTNNLVITVTGVGSKNLSAILSDVIPDIQLTFNGQCFPIKLYKKNEAGDDLFANQSESEDFIVSDGIADDGLKHFLDTYSGKTFEKEDLFYYIYGLLHSTDYRERFQNNFSKELPRIPAVKKFKDFMTFSKAGRKLGDLHVNYETVEPYPVTFKEGDLRLADTSDPKSFYRVKKMKFANKHDKSTVIYNNNITIEGIPLEAYEYVVNAKSALAWVMERQCVKTEKASGIVNDANDYANETMNNPAYPLELFQRVITVSLETMKIVRSLPKLDI
jgi:predicted helicase